MRRFVLWNHDETDFIDLNSRKNFAVNPEGLGLTYDLSFQQANNIEYLESKRVSNIPIKLKIVFGIASNAYESYVLFEQFILANVENTFIFEYHDDFEPTYKEVHFKSISKTEKNEYGTLECDLTLIPNGQRYIKNEKSIDLNSEVELETAQIVPINVEIKTENLTNVNVVISQNYQIVSNINFLNYTFGPEQTIIDAPGTYGERRDRFVLDSMNKKMINYHWIVNSDNEAEETPVNIYGQHDLTTDSFAFLPVGKSKIKVLGTGTADVKIIFRRYV